jgi:SPP1 family predicted phage head-tail adaptor
MTRPGEYRHWVELQKSDTEVDHDEHGEEILFYLTYASVWAKITDLSVRESFDAQQHYSEVSTSIKIRWRDDVKPTHRVKYGVKIYEIVGPPIDDGLQTEIELKCKRIR